METNNPGREDRPNHTNPDEVNFTHPAKETKAQEKIDIVQSGLGREVSQKPADEHIENKISQIDEGTKELQQSQMQGDDTSDSGERPLNSAGYMNDESSADRDTGNSHDDGWEESRTSRHK
jgi:hypothetical protein